MYPIRGKGLTSYLRHVFSLRKHLRENPVDITHGHFIWSIIVCQFQHGCKRVGTFHGTDLNDKYLRWMARFFVIPFLDKTIVVSPKMAAMIGRKDVSVIPCGIDIDMFHPHESNTISIHPLIDPKKKNILFASRFDRYEKNYPLAKEAVLLLKRSYQINLIELKDRTRAEVNVLLNQVDLLLLTSLWEGSPQVVKEAMACNCPVVTTDVGDVRWLLDGVANSVITNHDPVELAAGIKKVIEDKRRTNGRERISQISLDVGSIAAQIIDIYQHISSC